MATMTVKAKKLIAHDDSTTGDFITGLDNAYVVEIRERYQDEDLEILCHDSDGEEVKLTCGRNMRITIERK